MKLFQPASPIAKLRARRARVADEHTAADRAATAAADAKLSLLTADAEPDAKTLARAAAAAVKARVDADTLAALVRDLDRLLDEAERADAAALEKAERERVAAELRRRAESLRRAGARFAEAASSFKNERVLFESAVAQAADCAGRAPELVADAAVRAALRTTAPRQHPTPAISIEPVRDVEGETGQLAEALTSRAAAVEAGEVPPELPAPPPEPHVVVSFTVERITLDRAVSWIDADGRLQRSIVGECDLPAPAAAEARRRGWGHAPASAAAKRIMTALARPAGGRDGSKVAGERVIIHAPPWHPLDCNLHAEAEAERERARAERAEARKAGR